MTSKQLSCNGLFLHIGPLPLNNHPKRSKSPSNATNRVGAGIITNKIQTEPFVKKEDNIKSELWIKSEEDSGTIELHSNRDEQHMFKWPLSTQGATLQPSSLSSDLSDKLSKPATLNKPLATADQCGENSSDKRQASIRHRVG